MRVAIIGSGITGLAAARALATRHEVTIFEAADRPGGHVYTVEVGAADRAGVAGGTRVAVDMGFIVHNRENYPRFTAMLAELGVPTRPTTMSFSVSHDGLEWGSESVSALFAQRRRLFDPRHWRLLVEVVRFLRQAERDLPALHAVPAARAESLDAYLERRHVSRDVRGRFVVPLAAALWSLAPELCGAFPAVTYVKFLAQHGMLSPLRPLAWRTIEGGSKRYVDALLARLPVELRLATPVQTIARGRRGPAFAARRGTFDAGSVTIVARGREDHFDRAIVATHADTALALLAEPTHEERRVLGAFRYSTNRTVLHTDRSFLPAARAAHASWNYVAAAGAGVAVTYSMTKLQGLPDAPYLVTLNPREMPRQVLHDATFAHPQLDRIALAAQAEVAQLPGPVQFAGAHLGFGFHEDGMRAGELAAARVEQMAPVVEAAIA